MLRSWITAAALAVTMAAAVAQDGRHADGQAITMEQAVVLRQRLADDILVLRRAVELQSLLLAWNGVRVQHHMAPATLPSHLCRTPALAPHCGALPATFGAAQ